VKKNDIHTNSDHVIRATVVNDILEDLTLLVFFCDTMYRANFRSLYRKRVYRVHRQGYTYVPYSVRIRFEISFRGTNRVYITLDIEG
jgi:hypothetical protein